MCDASNFRIGASLLYSHEGTNKMNLTPVNSRLFTQAELKISTLKITQQKFQRNSNNKGKIENYKKKIQSQETKKLSTTKIITNPESTREREKHIHPLTQNIKES